MSQLAYHEQKDIENIQKLRALIKELPLFVLTFFEELNRGHPPEHESPMLTIYMFFLIFLSGKIRYFGTKSELP